METAMQTILASGLQLLVARVHTWVEGGEQRALTACLKALQGWQPAYLAERQNVVIERGVHQRWEFDRRALFAPLAEAIEVVRMYQEMG